MLIRIGICFLLLCAVESSKILGIFPTPNEDHFKLGVQLLKELSRRGHQVTLVSPFLIEEQNKNLTIIEVSSEIKLLVEDSKSSFINKIDTSFITTTRNLYSYAYDVTNSLLSDPNFQYLLQSGQKFDLIVSEYFMNEALLGIAPFLNVNVTVLLSPLPASSLMDDLFANPAPSSYIPNILTGLTGSMSFVERFHNYFCNLVNRKYKSYITLPNQGKLLRKYINSNYDLDDVIPNVDLVLLNSHASITEPVPHSANMVEIAGLHLTEPKPLSDELELFLSAGNAVYFALNSDLKGAMMDRKLSSILHNFEKLENLRMIWNIDITDIEIDRIPKNVMFVQDVAHEDILAHNSIVAFINDGNLFRIIEAVYYRTPIIGVPLINDQKTNIAKAVKDGYAIKISYEELTGEKLIQAISEIQQWKYVDNVRKSSLKLKDQLASPLEMSVFWIEYAIRHGGTKHLQSPGVYLSTFKRQHLDLLIVLLIIDILLLLLFYYIFKHILHLLKQRHKKREIKNYNHLEEDVQNSYSD